MKINENNKKLKDLIKLNNSTSQKELLDILNLDQDTFVYCDSVSNLQEKLIKKIEIEKVLKVGDFAVCRYLNIDYFNNQYIFEVFKVGFSELCKSYYLYLYNKNGPCSIVKDFRRNIFIISYKNDSSYLHREFLPAYIICNFKGTLLREEYLIKGKRHNSIGPAIRVYNFTYWSNMFYINDINISLKRFTCFYNKNGLNND